MPNLSLKPTQKKIAAYYESLATFAKLGIAYETAVRSAFQMLLDECGRQFGWKLVPEYPIRRKGQKPLRADGALVDIYNLPHGLWEAKDTDDDLEKEIKTKLALGYPKDNLLFQSPTRAVLYQNGQRVFDDTITKPEHLIDALRLFLEFEPPAFAEWEKSVEEFKNRIAEYGHALRDILTRERKTNLAYVAAFTDFLALCRASLNPNLSEEAVTEMLIQHILTERIFRKIFAAADFMQRNVIAVEIEKVIQALTSQSFTRDAFLKNLDRFYLAIEHAAATITDFSEKQKFLNTVYERFFQGFAVKQADTLGIVYTPQPIVDFMVASVEKLLQKEFQKSLADKNVQILDGFTGTGNFVVNLMQAIPRSALPHKYAHELHCNEVMLLPYYIASMNIEHEYFEATGKYAPFDGICLVDTFETAENAQHELGFMNEANSQRVARQKKAPIFVCIGNPPYNAWQVNENDNNRNRKYPVIDDSVRRTYGDDSTAQNRNSLSDPYIKAFRWASNRVISNGEGIVAFVTNNAFLDSLACDGMRKHLALEFDQIYVVDLNGNVRKNPKLSGTTHNVFGIQVGVSIIFLIRLPHKTPKKRKAKILYHAVPPDWRRTDKTLWLEKMGHVEKVQWQKIIPDKRHNWLQTGLREEFETFLPLGDREALGQNSLLPPLFRHYSRGVATSRDAWSVNFNREALAANMEHTIEAYNSQVQLWSRLKNKPNKVEDFIDFASNKVSWSESLKKEMLRGKLAEFDDTKIRKSLYRPFTTAWLYFDKMMNERRYGFDEIFPMQKTENVVICVTDAGGRSPFSVLASDRIVDLHLAASTDTFQCFPFYTYDEDGTNRNENIPLSALLRFQKHYDNDDISKWDIFYYLYALLHHPEYRSRYAANLKRELPRIPLIPALEDFRTFAKVGKKLATLHIHYDTAKEYPLKPRENPDFPLSYRVERMRLSADKTELQVNDFLTLANIPPKTFDYRLGNRSALEWVIDQYQVSVDTRSGIENDPNNLDDEKAIIRLVAQVITVSLETQKLVASLPALAE